MALIFSASTDLLSTQHTSRYLVPFLRWLMPDVSGQTIIQIHFFLRKAAHVTEYAILAVLLWRAFRFHRIDVRSSLWPQAAIALVITVLFAMSDEYHQSYVPSRGASHGDVMIDSCGALAALAVRWGISRRRIAG